MSDHNRWEPLSGAAGGRPPSAGTGNGAPAGPTTGAPPADSANGAPEGAANGAPAGPQTGVPSWAKPGGAEQDWGAPTAEVRPAWAPNPSWGADTPTSGWGTDAAGQASAPGAWGTPGSQPGPDTGVGGPAWPPPDQANQAGQGRQRRGSRPSLSRTLAAALIAAVLLATGYGLRAFSDRGSSTSAGVPTAGAPTAVVSAPLKSGTEPVATVAKALLPTVVQLQTQDGLGSGVIYDKNGYILTAAHVVDGTGQVTVRLSDGSELNGRVLGTDPGNDIAVVKVDRTGLKAAPLALGVEPQVGQMAVAIGSPFGLDQTVTAGVVSATHRALPISQSVAVDAIQTDAPINPGNSGGALADREGRVIGINDAIRSQSGGNEGIGFAIPITTAAASATRIVKGEPPASGYLGVSSQTQTQGHAGALVAQVLGGGPAAKAGMKVGDLITAVNGRSVQGADDLQAIVRSLQPGQQASVTLLRGGRQMTLTVTLGSHTDTGNG